MNYRGLFHLLGTLLFVLPGYSMPINCRALGALDLLAKADPILLEMMTSDDASQRASELTLLVSFVMSNSFEAYKIEKDFKKKDSKISVTKIGDHEVRFTFWQSPSAWDIINYLTKLEGVKRINLVMIDGTRVQP